MTKLTEASPSNPNLNERSTLSIEMGLVLIYEYRVSNASDVPPLLHACQVLADSVGQESDHLEICWLYGQDPTKPRTIRCLAGFWSLSAHTEFNKTKPLKHFVSTTRELPHETSVQLIEHLKGSVLPHRQLLQEAA